MLTANLNMVRGRSYETRKFVIQKFHSMKISRFTVVTMSCNSCYICVYFYRSSCCSDATLGGQVWSLYADSPLQLGLWGIHSSSHCQALHPEQQDSDLPGYNITCLELPTQLPTPVSNSDCFQLFNITCKNLTSFAPMDSGVELNFADFNCTMNSDNEPSSLFIYAYFITASLYLPSLAAFMYYAVRREYLRKCCFKKTVIQEDNTSASGPVTVEKESESAGNRYPLSYILILFTLIFCFMFLYVGLEAGFGSLIFTVAVRGRLGFSKPTAAILQSVYWGTFAFTRLVSVTLAVLKVRASIMIMGNLLEVL